MPVLHELKIEPQYYDKVLSGEKTFEIRKNDRYYSIGDTLNLNEYIKDVGYTGRTQKVTVSYISAFMQQSGYCVLSIKKVASPVDLKALLETPVQLGNKGGILSAGTVFDSNNPVEPGSIPNENPCYGCHNLIINDTGVEVCFHTMEIPFDSCDNFDDEDK